MLIRNTFSETQTAKKHPDHGLGLKSVRSVIEKYDGIVDITKSNDIFSVAAMLYVKAES